MRGRAVGLDCGSAFCKGVLLADGRVETTAVEPTGWDIPAAGRRVLAALLRGRGDPEHIKGDIPIAVTGYGREKIPAARSITEISCHARGAEYLLPGARCVVDIGGQDYKVIEIRAGKVVSFQMNDKCAAGSGRFLDMVLKRLEAAPAEMDDLLAADKILALNSACVVFAESEIIGLLSRGASREEILGGVVSSLASRVASQAARLTIAAPTVLTGGLSFSRGMAGALSKALGLPVNPAPDGLYAGAIGAACLALENLT